MVETLSNLVSHANATIQLNALWGLMVSEERRQGGREGGRVGGREGEWVGGRVSGWVGGWVGRRRKNEASW